MKEYKLTPDMIEIMVNNISHEEKILFNSEEKNYIMEKYEVPHA